MALELFSIVGRLALEGQEAVLDGLENVNQESASTEGALSSLGDGMQSVGDRTASLGGRFTTFATGPIAALGAAVVGLVGNFSSYADELAKTSNELGINIEALQEIEFALGQLTQLTDREARRALERLNQTIAEGTQGNESSVESLQALGFSQQDIASGAVDVETAFMRGTEAIVNAGSRAEATSLAMELFGRRVGRRLAPAIREAGDDVGELRERFRELGIGISEEQAEAAEEFNDLWDEVRRQLQDVALQLGSELLPLLRNFVEFIQTNVVPGVQAAGEALGALASAFGALPEPLQSAIGLAAGFVAAVGPVLFVVGRLVSLLGGLVSGLAAVAGGKGALIAAAAPLTPLLIKVAAAVAAAIAVFKALEVIGKAIGNLAGFIVTEWDSVAAFFTETIPNAAGAAMDAFGNAAASFRQFAQRVMAGAVDLAASVVDAVRGMFGQVRGFFADLPGMAIGFVTNMVQGVIQRVRDMVSQVVGAVQGMFGALVGNSIFPDLAAGAIDQAEKMREGVGREAGGMADDVTRAAASMPEDILTSGGGQGGQGVSVDMRGAVIRDDRDMLERMRRRGLDLSGAFG